MTHSAPTPLEVALIHAPDQEETDLEAGSAYWHSQARQGRVLTGVEKEWADAHAARLTQAEKYAHHLREAGRLGNQHALLDLAERFGDPSFFAQPRHDVGADPAAVAEIAERLGRVADAKHWLTVAAESGDTDAMLRLIEEHDQGDPARCWTWAYLSRLVGTDLTKDAHYAINEDGSEYDDDVGGPAYAAGRDGVDLRSSRCRARCRCQGCRTGTVRADSAVCCYEASTVGAGGRHPGRGCSHRVANAANQPLDSSARNPLIFKRARPALCGLRVIHGERGRREDWRKPLRKGANPSSNGVDRSSSTSMTTSTMTARQVASSIPYFSIEPASAS